MTETIWLDRELVDQMIPGIDFPKLEYDPDTGLYCLAGEPFTGVVKSRYPDGSLRGLGHQRGGVEEGISVAWHPNGQIELYSEMRDDVYHGRHAEWDKNGIKLVEEQYANGRLIHPNNTPREHRCGPNRGRRGPTAGRSADLPQADAHHRDEFSVAAMRLGRSAGTALVVVVDRQ